MPRLRFDKTARLEKLGIDALEGLSVVSAAEDRLELASGDGEKRIVLTGTFAYGLDGGLPLSGEVTALTFWEDGEVELNFDRLSIAVDRILAALRADEEEAKEDAEEKDEDDDEDRDEDADEPEEEDLLDVIFAGDDRIRGRSGDDRLEGRGGDDRLEGRDGDDDLDGGDGHDRVYGGEGEDVVTGGAGKDRLSGADGADLLDGGSGHDLLDGGGDDDALAGGDGKDRLDGRSGNDALDGGAGNDRLYGGTGEDVLTGGAGRDHLVGGGGADLFVFASASDSGVKGRDRISDFDSDEDRIDLSLIDADLTQDGDQAFDLQLGRTRFSGDAGELIVRGRVLYGDQDGDRKADFAIQILGDRVDAEDFIL